MEYNGYKETMCNKIKKVLKTKIGTLLNDYLYTISLNVMPNSKIKKKNLGREWILGLKGIFF